MKIQNLSDIYQNTAKTLTGKMIDILIKGVLIPALSFFATELIKKLFPGEDDGFPWLRWLSLCAIGGVIGAVFSASMGMTFSGFGNWAAYGAAVGILQAVALEPFLHVGGWWAAATTLGWTIVPVAPIIIGTVLAGFLVGILQAPLLQVGINKIVLWIMLNAVVCPFSAFIGIIVQGFIEPTSLGFLAFFLSSGVGTLSGSIVTGTFLSTLRTR